MGSEAGEQLWLRPITEAWLKEVGFKWAQFDRQPEKMWILWLGDALLDHSEPERGTGDFEQLGIEVTANYRFTDQVKNPDPISWFCWLRADTSHRYHRFLHVRHLLYQNEIAELVQALTGRTWNPENHIYGSVHTPKAMQRIREEHDRLDKRIARDQHTWYDHEKDGDRAKPLPEDKDAAIKGGLAK